MGWHELSTAQQAHLQRLFFVRKRSIVVVWPLDQARARHRAVARVWSDIFCLAAFEALVGPHRRHVHLFSRTHPTLVFIAAAGARLTLFGEAEADLLQPVAGAAAGDGERPWLQTRIDLGEIGGELGRWYELWFVRVLVPLRDADRLDQPTGEGEVSFRFEARTGAVRFVFVDDEACSGHRVEHLIDEVLRDVRAAHGAAVLRVVLLILRPEPMQHERKAPTVAAVALHVVVAGLAL